MGQIFRIIIILAGILFLAITFNMLIRRRISERNSLSWLFWGVLFVLFAAFPDMLDHLAHLVGVSYPPSLLFFFSSILVILIIMGQSVQLTQLEVRSRELAQLVAIVQNNEDKRREQESDDRMEEDQA